MRATSSPSRLVAFFAALLLSLFAMGIAHAQQSGGEPSVAQIYQAANTGDLARAQTMIDSVIEKHPNSARAHYVKSELSARQKNMSVARSELATAERLAPGLPFVKAESVQALRSQIAQAPASRGGALSEGASTRQLGGPPAENGARDAVRTRGIPWGMLALAVGVVLVGVAFMRRRAASRNAAAYGGAGFGANANMGNPGFGNNVTPGPYGNPAGPQPGYGPGYPQGPGMQGGPGYGQPSMGGSVMRGLGAGLAVGAGAVAAQEIGRRIFSHDDPHAASGAVTPPDPAAIDAGMQNSDMGGDNFGMTAGGWDDAGAAGGGDLAGGGDFSGGDAGGGSDWDT